MGSTEEQMPMDDASMSTDPMMGDEMPMDPMMGQGTEEGGMDPMMGGEDPMADNMNTPEAPMGNEGDDSTTSIINQLSDEDKKAVRAYAESMLSKSNGGEENNGGDMGEVPGNNNIAESTTFTKKQIEMLKETFGINKEEEKDERKTLGKKEKGSKSSKSPFNSPFN